MKNNITKDIEYMKYVLGYKRGVVISEQPIKKTSLSEQNNNEKPPVGCIDGDCENGTGTYKFPGGDEYTGQWKDDIENGQGTFICLNNDKSNMLYKKTGEWKDGKLFNGYTIYDSFYYEVKDGLDGEIIYGKPPEQNKETEQNNNVNKPTEGCVTGDCEDGEGTYKFADGSEYTGLWKNKNFNGQGTYTKDDGVKISGNWVDGKLDEKQNNETELINKEQDKTQNNSDDCVQPTKPTHRYKNDRNYRYAKSGDCWWAKNITNNKWFNLTELVKTKPKVQSSIDKLNNGTDLIKL